MSEEDVVNAYATGQMSRREFVQKMAAFGGALAFAMAAGARSARAQDGTDTDPPTKKSTAKKAPAKKAATKKTTAPPPEEPVE